MISAICVGAGGFLGAVGRYTLSTALNQGEFPLITMIINLTGSFIIGIIIGITGKLNLPPNLILFLKVGVCGGFTTFSTFSAETLALLERNKYALGIGYALISVTICVLGVWLGKMLTALLIK